MPGVLLDSIAIARLLRSEDGPVMRDLSVRGTRVQQRARELVGKKTRKLEFGIVKRFARDANGPFIAVGFSDRPPLGYGIYHHEGTPAHVIRPRRARVLAFYWPKVGRVVYLREVHHPGTRPNRFLTGALDAAR